MVNTSSNKQSGRRGSVGRVRELMGIVGSLHEQGDTLSVSTIAARLGITVREARSMMDIVCQAAGENTGGLLIASDDDETEYTLQYPGIHGNPLRLTPAETVALLHALDEAGVEEEDPLRNRIMSSFASDTIREAEVRQVLGGGTTDPRLMICAQAQAQERTLSFMYRGIHDTVPRKRNIAVRSLEPSGSSWLVRGFDTDIDQERTFRVDRMTEVSLGDPAELSSPPSHATRMVSLVFFDETYYTLFDWPHMTVIRRDQGMLYTQIPYYEGSDWLIRRIAACNTKVLAEDEGIMAAVKAYAQSQLAAIED